MKEILQPLLAAIDAAKLRACINRPDGTASEAYLFGYAQGRYAGLDQAREIIENVIEEQDRKERKR